MAHQRAHRGFLGALSALGVLSAMALSIGGVDGFSSLIRSLAWLFLVAAWLAFVAGYFLHRQKAGWSVLSGGAIGLAVGVAILVGAVSRI